MRLDRLVKIGTQNRTAVEANNYQKGPIVLSQDEKKMTKAYGKKEGIVREVTNCFSFCTFGDLAQNISFYEETR